MSVGCDGAVAMWLFSSVWLCVGCVGRFLCGCRAVWLCVKCVGLFLFGSATMWLFDGCVGLFLLLCHLLLSIRFVGLFSCGCVVVWQFFECVELFLFGFVGFCWVCGAVSVCFCRASCFSFLRCGLGCFCVAVSLFAVCSGL